MKNPPSDLPDDMTREKYETSLAELLFIDCYGDFDWKECLAFGKEAAVILDKFLDSKRLR